MMSIGQKIDLMIVGAQKAGTTSLNNYLCEHPEVLGHASLQKEFAYFWDDSIFEKGFEAEFDKAFIKKRTTNKVKIVAKNVGISNNEQALKRLQEHNKDCKLVFIVREPVSRAYSSYTMEVFNGWMDRDFSELKQVLSNNDKSDAMYRFFIEPSLYVNHLHLIYKYFPKNQVRVYLFDDFKSNPERICKEVFEWLDISTEFLPAFENVHNETKQAKSKLMSKLILSIRKQDSVIKKIVKVILPYTLFSKIGTFVVESNKSSKKADKITPAMKEYLTNYFMPFNENLAKETNLPVQEKWINKK